MVILQYRKGSIKMRFSKRLVAEELLSFQDNFIDYFKRVEGKDYDPRNGTSQAFTNEGKAIVKTLMRIEWLELDLRL